MQDEPGAEVCFSYEMSLEERSGMLGVDRQRAGRSEAEPGADPGIFGGERGGSVRREGPGGGIRLGEPNAAWPGLPGLEAKRPGVGTAVRRKDDGT